MPWMIPISGTTKLHRLQENVASTNVELIPTDLAEIDTASAQLTVHGNRYSDAAQRMIDR